MKPIQIGLLVLVGALGGALVMKFTQRPKPAPVTVASAAPAAIPATADVPVTPAAGPAPVEAVTPQVQEATPAPAPKHERRAAIPVTPRSHPMIPHTTVRTPRVEATVAQNRPPAQPSVSAAEPPAPAPIQEIPQAAPAPETAAPTESAPPAAAEPPAAPEPAPSVTLQAGMVLPIRLGENLSSEHNQAGDTFTGTLDAPLTAGGFVIAERGAHVEGRIMEAQKAHVRGAARLALELTKLSTSDGQHVEIKTEIVRRESASMGTTDQVGVVAAAAGIGAIIGAMAGGGKGAAIGAGAGGAAGGGGVAATRNKPVSLTTESKLTFRLSSAVTITEQINQ